MNAPWTFSGIWNTVSGFMDETVVEKVQICGDFTSPKLLTMAELDQIEKRYGGSAPDRTTSFWPPKYAMDV